MHLPWGQFFPPPSSFSSLCPRKLSNLFLIPSCNLQTPYISTITMVPLERTSVGTSWSLLSISRVVVGVCPPSLRMADDATKLCSYAEIIGSMNSSQIAIPRLIEVAEMGERDRENGEQRPVSLFRLPREMNRWKIPKLSTKSVSHQIHRRCRWVMYNLENSLMLVSIGSWQKKFIRSMSDSNLFVFLTHKTYCYLGLGW